MPGESQPVRYLVVDAHEDIAWNVASFGRDYRGSAWQIRRAEHGGPIPGYNGNAMLGRTEWLIGRVGLIFATLFAAPARHRYGEWDTQSYADSRAAYDVYSRQLDIYHRFVDQNPGFQLVLTQADLDSVLATWAPEKSIADRRIGLVILMEGADAIQDPAQVEDWYARGLRLIGPAWEATRYAGGTHEPGPLTSEGFALLEAMAGLSMILDLSHLAEEACFQALDVYPGTVIASHSNPHRFLPTSRGLSDTMIRRIAEHDGVVGIVPYNRFLKPGWARSDPRNRVPFSLVADAIDHVCQITGSVDHVGIGSDFDGGFGLEHTPEGFDSVADFQRLAPLLESRGMSPSDVSAILSGNWLRMLHASLPAT